MYTSLTPQTIPVEAEPKYQTPTPPSQRFGPRLQTSKIAWAPAPQRWFEPGTWNQFVQQSSLFLNKAVLEQTFWK